MLTKRAKGLPGKGLSISILFIDLQRLKAAL